MSRQAANPGRVFATRNDLPEGTRLPIIAILNQSLADTTDLATQAKQAHWNVKGPEFQQLHELFDEQATLLLEHADLIAERATALGGRTAGTARAAASSSRIAEFPEDAILGMECVDALANRFGTHAANLRSGIDVAAEYGDEDTADLYTELSREIDKQLWFLEAHLQNRESIERTGATDARDG